MYRKEKVDPMSQGNYFIITNNPLVLEKLGETHNVIYQEISYEEVLKDPLISVRSLFRETLPSP